jgi:hypothetical protein
MTVQEYRNKMIAELRRCRSNQSELVEEYIEESEHQEGFEYWYEFESIGEMLTDFDLYAEGAS